MIKKTFVTLILILLSNHSYAQNCNYDKNLKLNEKVEIIGNCNVSEKVKISLLKNILKETNKLNLEKLNLSESEILKLNDLVILNLPNSKINTENIFSTKAVYNENGTKELLYQTFGLFGKNSIIIERIDSRKFILKYNTSPYLKDTKIVNVTI